MKHFEFKALTDAGELNRFLNQTKLNEHNNVFSSSHWYKESTQAKNVAYILLDENKDIQQSLHLNITTKCGFSIAEFAGEPYIQYNDAINHGDKPISDFVAQSIQHLKSMNVDAIYLHNVREDAHIFEYCQQNGNVIETKQAPWIDLAKFENYEAFFESTSKTVRKVYRRLFREFDVKFEVYLDEEISEQLIDDIINLKIKQLGEVGRSSRVFMSSARLAELRTIFTHPNDDFKIFVSVIKCDDVLVSGAISLIKDGIYYGYIVAMNTEYTKYAPGNAHVLLNVNWSYENGVTDYDFLSPSDEYKIRWAKNNSIPVYDFIIPMNRRGKMFGSIYLKKIRPLLKKFYLAVTSRQYKRYNRK